MGAGSCSQANLWLGSGMTRSRGDVGAMLFGANALLRRRGHDLDAADRVQLPHAGPPVLVVSRVRILGLIDVLLVEEQPPPYPDPVALDLMLQRLGAPVEVLRAHPVAPARRHFDDDAL